MNDIELRVKKRLDQLGDCARVSPDIDRLPSAPAARPVGRTAWLVAAAVIVVTMAVLGGLGATSRRGDGTPSVSMAPAASGTAVPTTRPVPILTGNPPPDVRNGGDGMDYPERNAEGLPRFDGVVGDYNADHVMSSLPNHEVRILDAGGNVLDTLTTDPYGTFITYLPPGRYTAESTLSCGDVPVGFTQANDPIGAIIACAHDVSLQPGATPVS